MAYIGKSPTGTGVRQRYYFTATGGETSLSGADDNGLTLSYSDGAYVDVLLNGIELVAGTDYNTSTANTIAGLSALAANDVVTVTVYDIFTVADTVSASNGGTFSGNVNMGGTLSVTGASTLTGDLTVDTDTLYVDSTNNRVGVGTTSPALRLDVKGASAFISDADAYTGGVGIASKIVAGGGSNDIGIQSQDIIQFATGGTTERIRISAGGMYFQGTTNDSLFSTTSDTGITLQGSGQRSAGTGTAIQISSDATENWANFYINRLNIASDARFVQFSSNGSAVGSISGTTSSTSYNTSSDYRLKENDVDMTGAIARVKQLQPKRFNFIADADTTVDGFMAHEVQTVVPEAISGTHNEVDDEGNPVYQGIDQSKLVPLLTGALQEAIAKIETLEAKVTALENA